jgi:homoserine O-succinyltransferase
MIEPGGSTMRPSVQAVFDADATQPHGDAQPNGDALTIALVNSMPDSALRATERQFCALLAVASAGRLVRLQFFSLPGIKRSPAARLHIARYYEDFAELERTPPDGIIVTGTEPRATSLEDEPYWPALARLIDWADEWAIPSIWSCLAAHAAVLRMDGIERHALGAKLSGIFECRINSPIHHILHGLPDRWRVPHSRFYGLHESALISRGYSILSRSREAGPDIFLRRSRGLQLFLQGHPEYGAAALLAEYRRDVARFLGGEQNICPDVPRHCYAPPVVSEFASLIERARHARNVDLPATFENLVAGATPEHSWLNVASRIYTNWLSYLNDSREQRLPITHLSRGTADARHLAA